MLSIEFGLGDGGVFWSVSFGRPPCPLQGPRTFPFQFGPGVCPNGNRRIVSSGPFSFRSSCSRCNIYSPVKLLPHVLPSPTCCCCCYLFDCWYRWSISHCLVAGRGHKIQTRWEKDWTGVVKVVETTIRKFIIRELNLLSFTLMAMASQQQHQKEFKKLFNLSFEYITDFVYLNWVFKWWASELSLHILFKECPAIHRAIVFSLLFIFSSSSLLLADINRECFQRK